MVKKKEIEELNPSEYFNNLKDKVQNITDEELVEFYQGCLTLVEKYKITGQKRVIQKLRFLVDCVEKEREAVKLGINSFVYREDIEEYIDNISKDVVKIIEVPNHPLKILLLFLQDLPRYNLLHDTKHKERYFFFPFLYFFSQRLLLL